MAATNLTVLNPLAAEVDASGRRDEPAVDEQRDQLLSEQLTAVRYIAAHVHRRLPNHVELEDLVQAGVLGLIDAVNRYDSGRRVQFQTYARFRIRGAILDSLRETDWGPRKLRSENRRLHEAEGRLSQIHRSEPDRQLVAQELGLSVKALHHLAHEIDASRIRPLTDDQPICADRKQDPFTQLLRSQMIGSVNHAIEFLTASERKVIELYYLEEMKMKDVADLMGVGESRVSQIHSKAVKKLQDRLGTK